MVCSMKRLYEDTIPSDAKRFLVLGACAQCGNDALCNYLIELNAAFCGPECADEYRKEAEHASTE